MGRVQELRELAGKTVEELAELIDPNCDDWPDWIREAEADEDPDNPQVCASQWCGIADGLTKALGYYVSLEYLLGRVNMAPELPGASS